MVEDDPALAQALALALSRRGFAVSQATNGRTALERATSEEFAAIVLDLTLPEMDGLEVLREIRQRGTTTPVIVLTARGTVGDRVQGLRLGADDYLPKPFDLDELEERVRALLRRGASAAIAGVAVATAPAAPGTFRTTPGRTLVGSAMLLWRWSSASETLWLRAIA